MDRKKTVSTVYRETRLNVQMHPVDIIIIINCYN